MIWENYSYRKSKRNALKFVSQVIDRKNKRNALKFANKYCFFYCYYLSL